MTTIIEHPEHGRVEGVKRADGQGGDYPVAGWGKNGAVYFVTHGWREVKPVVDVTEQVKLLEEKTGRQLIDELPADGIELPNGKRLWFGIGCKGHKTQAVVLPEDWWDKWVNESQPLHGFPNFIKQFKQSVLLIKRESGEWVRLS